MLSRDLECQGKGSLDSGVRTQGQKCSMKTLIWLVRVTWSLNKRIHFWYAQRTQNSFKTETSRFDWQISIQRNSGTWELLNCVTILKSRIALPEVKGILTSRTRFLIAFNFNSFVSSLDEIISSPYRFSLSLVKNEIHIIAQVVDLVRYVHSKNYLLNDFGLENFLLRPDYNLKMTNAEKIRPLKSKRSKDSKNCTKESFQKYTANKWPMTVLKWPTARDKISATSSKHRAFVTQSTVIIARNYSL